MTVGEQEIFFDRDEEGSFRGMTEPSGINSKPLSPELLQAIVVAIQKLLQ